MFESIFTFASTTLAVAQLSLEQAVKCLGTALICGLVAALVFYLTERCSKGFFLTLVLLPAVVSVVIIMVNGNLGAGIAVAGAFSLVRFRSLQGTAKEICAIFLAMAQGLAIGMGYLTFAMFFTAVACIVFGIISTIPLGKYSSKERVLRVTVPENLNYTDAFADLFKKYTKKCVFERSKTTNMGTLYELTYRVCLKDVKLEKEFIDELRCRNANLTIISTIPANNGESL
ncbi:MAG: DUF4956 domain-containing protein [Ruminococcaceae bacterium]|nr:DUF4956 domain-containing protein [Oscillospiraceae bacterium]